MDVCISCLFLLLFDYTHLMLGVSVCLLYNDFMFGLFFCFNFISTKQFISVLVFSFSLLFLFYPIFCLTLKFNFFLVHILRFFLQRQRQWHCIVLLIFTLFLFFLLYLVLLSKAFSRFQSLLFLSLSLSILSFCPLMALVSC